MSDDLLPVDPGPGEVTCVPGGIELRVRDKVSQLVDRFPVEPPLGARPTNATPWDPG